MPTRMAERVSPYARYVLADNASKLVFLGTNTWILADPGSRCCVVVDPGPLLDEHIDNVCAAIEREGAWVAAVLVTHNHVDHAEGAAAFAERVDAPLRARFLGNLPDGPLDLGGEAPALSVVSLPGHSSDSVGFVYPACASIFVGDFIFRQSSTLICWPDGRLSDYMESLDKLAALVDDGDVETLYPGHGLPIVDPRAAIARQKAHRLRRLEMVLRAMKAGAGEDVDLIIDKVYGKIDDEVMRKAVQANVYAQLDYLRHLRDVGKL